MRVHWLWLSLLPKLTVFQKLRLLEYFGDPESLYNADARTFKGIAHMTPEIFEQLMNKDLDKAHRLLFDCERGSIGFVTYTDSGYPARLRGLSDPPLILYYKGRLPDFEQKPLIGVVGTRKATPRGLAAAETLGGQIAACGGIVVSGGAVGIDSQALRGAYAAGKPTVTVLAGGLDRLYPKENEGLFRQLSEEGCLISEYPPGMASYKGNFLRRNRIISGMSNGVLVVEAPQVSGALNTARWALEQGKDLFAVPGPVGAQECAGTNALLEDGAHAAISGWAVMKNYAERYPHGVGERAFTPRQALKHQPDVRLPKRQNDKKDIDKRAEPLYSVIEKKLPPLTDREQLLVDCLRAGPVLSHVLAAETDMDTGEIMRLLTMLTMKDVVQTDPEGMVSLKLSTE